MDVAGLMHTWTTVMGYPYLKVVSEKWDVGGSKVHNICIMYYNNRHNYTPYTD
jgi:hypothetical protein